MFSYLACLGRFTKVLVVEYLPTGLVVEGFPHAQSNWPTIVNFAFRTAGLPEILWLAIMAIIFQQL